MLNSLGNRVENLLNWGDSFQWNIVSGILISFSSEKSRLTALKYLNTLPLHLASYENVNVRNKLGTT